MTFEHIEVGKSAQQIIEETMEDLDRGLYDDKDRNEVSAKLMTARITTQPDSPERQKIDSLLADIAARY